MPERRVPVMIATAITLLCSVILCSLVLVTHQGDPVTFAHIGTLFTNRTAAQPDPTITVGYDGQFVYYIARDGAAALPLIDGPSLRFQRILLPIAARALAFAQPALVPWALLAINLIAHAAGAGLMAYLLLPSRVPAVLGGLTYGLWIGILFAVRLNLTEVLCFALGLAAIVMYQKSQFRLTIVLLMLSTLSKEIGLVFAAGLALHAFFQGNRAWSVLIFGAPLLLLLSWWGVLRLMFGDVPTQYPAARLELVPFRGAFTADTDALELGMLLIWLIIPAVILLAMAARTVYQTRALSLSTALILPMIGFCATLSTGTWGDPAAAYRVAMPIVIGGLLLTAEHYPRWFKPFCGLWLSSLVLLPLLARLWLGGA
jgi:hypothetical protein